MIVSIHTGEAGIHCGLDIWELLSLEHGVNRDGYLISDKDKSESPASLQKQSCLTKFFVEEEKGRYKPRTVMLDLDSAPLDNIRCGNYCFYGLDSILSGKESAVNFARGYYSFGPNILNESLQLVRKMAEQCDAIQGILFVHSLGGGTGSGFGALLSNAVKQEFSKTSLFEYPIYSANNFFTHPSVLEPYNSVLSFHKNADMFRCSLMHDNGALSEICQKKLAIDAPTYSQMNRLIAQVFSSTSSRIAEFQVSLFPYPKAHYPVVGLAPLLKPSKIRHEVSSATNVTMEAFQPSNQIIHCDPNQGKSLACCLFYRGNIPPTNIYNTIDFLKAKRKCPDFVEGTIAGFKVGLNTLPTLLPERWEMDSPELSVCVMSNNTSIHKIFKNLYKKFEKLHQKKAFLHWYLSEGMEEQEFIDSQDTVKRLEKHYEEFEKGDSKIYERSELG